MVRGAFHVVSGAARLFVVLQKRGIFHENRGEPSGVLCDLRFCAALKPPLCKGRRHGVSRDGGIVMQPKHKKPLVPLAKQLQTAPLFWRGMVWESFVSPTMKPAEIPVGFVGISRLR